LTSLLLKNYIQKSRDEISRMIVAKQTAPVAKIVMTDLFYDVRRRVAKYGGIEEMATAVQQLLIGR
jgi:hypothetical protein